MLNEKVEIEIRGRRLLIEMEGLSPLEVDSLARLVTERIVQIEAETKIVDTSKLAILTALDIAAENQRLQVQLKDLGLTEKREVDAMTISLEKALGHSSEK